MELKKNKEFDLERKTPLFFTIGLVIAMSFVLIAFEWKSEYDPIEITQPIDPVDPLYVPKLTKHPEPKPPKPVEKKETVKPKSNNPPIIIEKEEVKEIEEQVKLDAEDDFDDLPEIVIEGPATEEAPEIFDFVESEPEYPGGDEAFLAYLASQIKYPRKAARMGVEGIVFLQYIINTDGSITDIKVLKGIGYGCDDEAIRVLSTAPKWFPGKQRGVPVRVRQRVPISFTLRN